MPAYIFAFVQARFQVDFSCSNTGQILQYARASLQRQLQVRPVLPTVPVRWGGRNRTNYFSNDSRGVTATAES